MVGEAKMPKKNQYQDISVGLNEKDRLRIAELAGLQGRTKTEVAREAIRWYMDNYEQIKNQSRDGEIAQAIKYATDELVKAINKGVERICKMLSRQGVAIGTLYELSWMALPDDENAKRAFEAASNTAKQKMRRRVELDEAELAERQKKVVTS
jgi:predicted DNA-binding protein